MNLNNYKYLIITLAMSSPILWSCGGSDDSNDQDPVLPIEQVETPGNAILIFPENNTECNNGEIVSETKSRVTFTWSASENTTTYEVNLKNLSNNNFLKQTSNSNEATIIIDRGTPYEWFVTSSINNSSTIGKSSTWSFYNEGPGLTNYAPFPAQAITPKRGESLNATNGKIDLMWTSNDIDNDIISYEIFLDTEEHPITSIGTTVENTILSIPVNSGSIYKWKVITFDSNENSSTSEVFEFKIN